MPVASASIPALVTSPHTRVAIPDPRRVRAVKLGRKPPAEPVRGIRLSRFLDRNHLTVPPPSVRYDTAAGTALARVYLNDRYGDCVIASTAHQLGVWTANDTQHTHPGGLEFPDAQILSTYQRWCGPGDNGCVIQDVLQRWQNVGFPDGYGGHQIDDFVALDPTDRVGLQVAVHLFGGVKIGLNYLDAWQSQSVPDGVWDDVPGSSLGGHDVPGLGYDVTRGLRVATWGMTLWLTWAALANSSIVDEVWLPLGKDWYGAGNLSPAGLDVDALREAIAEFKAGRIPADPPSPVPPVPVPPVPPIPPTPAPGPAATLTLTGTGRGWWGTETITMSGTAVPIPTPGAHEFSDQELDQLGVPPARRQQFRETMRTRAEAQTQSRAEQLPGGAGPTRGGSGPAGSIDWAQVGQLILQVIVLIAGGLWGAREKGS